MLAQHLPPRDIPVETLPAMTAIDNDVYKTLLESTKAIPWRIDWKSMTFSYIGARRIR